MLIDYHNFFDNSALVKATRAVVYDNLSNPIALFLEHSDSVISCYTAADADFSDKLRQCGITPPNIKKVSIGG